MNILLIFFAIPLATIILSAILETLIDNPLKVAGIFFSIFIVVAFALGGSAELVLLALIYTIISFITALIVFTITHKKDCDNSDTETVSTRIGNLGVGYTDYSSGITTANNTENYNFNLNNSVTENTEMTGNTSDLVTRNLSNIRCNRRWRN